MSDDKPGKGDDGKLLYCSFCGKSQHEVRKLIAGPSVFICDECVELCNDIIREEMQEGSADQNNKLLVNRPPLYPSLKKLMNTWISMSLARLTPRKCCQLLFTITTSVSKSNPAVMM